MKKEERDERRFNFLKEIPENEWNKIVIFTGEYPIRKIPLWYEKNYLFKSKKGEEYILFSGIYWNNEEFFELKIDFVDFDDLYGWIEEEGYIEYFEKDHPFIIDINKKIENHKNENIF